MKEIKIPPLCEELAEDIGIQVGDGCICISGDGKLKSGRQRYKRYIQISGNITEDRDYLKNHVYSLKRKLYGNNFSIFFRDNKSAGTIVLNIICVKLFNFYKDIGLPIGPKNNVRIPKFIFKNKKLQISFVKGLADTDGSISFRKGYYKNHSSPCIRFATKSKGLADDLCKILDNLEFTYTYVKGNKRFDKRTNKTYIINDVYVSGKKNLEKWMKLIGFNNPAKNSRYQIYKKFGFCPPGTTFKERLYMLKQNNLNP